MIKKGAFETFSFIWVFLVIFSFGAYLLSFGFKELSVSPNNMVKDTGVITKIEYKDPFVYINLNTSSYNYKTSNKESILAIKNNLKIGDKVTIYLKEKDFYFIQMIVKNKKVIVKFKKQSFLNILIFSIGFLIVLFSFYYLGRKIQQNFGDNLITKILIPWRISKK